MKIPRIFGNGVILVVVALALLGIVIFSLLKVVNFETTGFASLNQGNNQNLNENIDNNPGNPFSITILSNNSELLTNTSSDYNSTNLSSNTTQQRRGTSHGRGHGGGGSGSLNPGNPNNQTNPNLPPYLKKKLTKKPNNLNLKMNGTETTNGEEFEGIVRLNLYKSNRRISDFDIDFYEDADLSDIIADSDSRYGKSFMHSRSGRLKNINLYVPREEGDIAVVVCSNASSYDEIYYGCSNNSHVTKEEILYINNSRIEISLDGLYFIVHGITGTGAMGVNVTELNSTKQNATAPGDLEAYAGNVTEITTPQGLSTTQAWQGYFGNISGTIMLADSSDNVMYNWSLASPEGQIFASTNNSIGWDNIQCFNFTASGTYGDEAGNGGETNLYGTNLTQLESQYNIGTYDLDGVDETFFLIGTNTHNTFYTNANQFDEGECQNTRIIDFSGFGQDNNFEEVLMYEPTTYSVIFGALLNEDVLGFDERAHDFEIIVLEDGHNTDTVTTIYYFYAVIF